MFNGIVKLPMQFVHPLRRRAARSSSTNFIAPPIFFNQPELARAEASARGAELRDVEAQFAAACTTRAATATAYVDARHGGDGARIAAAESALRRRSRAHRRAAQARRRAHRSEPRRAPRPRTPDYIFLRFVLAEFPPGLVGLLIAVILCAAMSATASALNSLGTTTVVDFYKRERARGRRRRALPACRQDASRSCWGALAVGFAIGASLFENLIQAVNILGSLFYGPMLGVFLVGFFTKRVSGTAAFVAVLAAEAAVISVWLGSSIGFLWYNVVGCAVVVAISLGSRLISAASTPPHPRR